MGIEAAHDGPCKENQSEAHEKVSVAILETLNAWWMELRKNIYAESEYLCL